MIMLSHHILDALIWVWSKTDLNAPLTSPPCHMCQRKRSVAAWTLFFVWHIWQSTLVTRKPLTLSCPEWPKLHLARVLSVPVSTLVRLLHISLSSFYTMSNKYLPRVRYRYWKRLLKFYRNIQIFHGTRNNYWCLFRNPIVIIQKQGQGVCLLSGAGGVTDSQVPWPTCWWKSGGDPV